ncbi:MAG: polysaccharide biosynthesis protein [Candidatus Competibacterales bacterium]
MKPTHKLPWSLPWQWRHPGVAFAHDVTMVPVAWLTAYWLRFDLAAIPEPFWRVAWLLLPLVVVLHAAVFVQFGLYRGLWRFASTPDLLRIAKAAVVAVALTALVVFLLNRMEHVPRSVLVLHGLLLPFLLGGPRLCYRLLKDHRSNRGREKVLIIGAGQAGERVVRELQTRKAHPYRPVAIVDPRGRGRGRELRGVPVVGGLGAIPALMARHGLAKLLVAAPGAPSELLRQVTEYAGQAPGGFQLLSCTPKDGVHPALSAEPRPIAIEELLGREPIRPRWSLLDKALTGRTVLVTGGGGSIGGELCRQLAAFKLRQLVVLDHSEHNLYQIDYDLRRRFPELSFRAVLGDVKDPVGLGRTFAATRPEIVFHAAAYKHVPLLEAQYREALLNNTFGTFHVAQSARQYGCQTLVLISTDKAVNPKNALGLSKRLAEMYCQHLGEEGPTRFITVRFGNVLNSAGSVVPLFRRQIEAGGPVTVTHPEVERYFMTIPEACQLIAQAAAVGEGGEIFVLDMGQPVKIQWLAEKMIALAGKVPHRDIAIEYTGLRPGEKLAEQLFHNQEGLCPTAHPKLLLAQPRRVDWSRFCADLEALHGACRGDHPHDMERLLQRLKSLEADGYRLSA